MKLARMVPVGGNRKRAAWLLVSLLLAWMSAGTCLAATETVLDTFSVKSYGNQDGTAEWSGNWQEYNDDDSPTSGDVVVNQDALRFKGSSQYHIYSVAISRGVDLSAADSAVLSFDFQTKNLGGWGDLGEVAVYISTNGGANWTWLTAINRSDPATGSWSGDISSYMTANTEILFYESEQLSSNEDIFIDNVQIAYEVPETTELVAHYALEGDVADGSGNGHDGGSQGTVSYQRAKVCDGVQLDGTGYLRVADSDDFDLPDAFTVMAWIHPDSLSVPGHDDLYSFLSKDDNYEFHVRSSGALYWWWGNGSFNSATGVIAAGEWSHVAFVYSRQAGSMRILVNGLEVASHAYSAALPVNTDAFLIGADIATGGSSELTGRRFFGSIDEVRLYNGALSDGDITALMNETDPCGLPTPLAEWRFDECGYEGASALAEDTQGHYDLSAQGGVAGEPEGVVGRAALLEAGGDAFTTRVDVPLQGDWTVTTWFRMPFAVDGESRYHVLGAMAGGGTDLLWIDNEDDFSWGAWANSHTAYGNFEFSTLTNGWHHLAAVAHNGRTDLYIDGVWRDSVSLQPSGNLHYVGTSYEHAGGDEGFRADLDEYLVFSGALSETQIGTLYQLQAEGRNLDGTLREEILCGPGIDHFEIVHDGSALTCVPEQVTVKACADADCTTLYDEDVEITLSPSGWLGGNTQTLSDGVGVFRLRHTTAETVSLAVTGNPAAEQAQQCVNSGDGNPCELTFYEAGFLYTLPNLEACQTSSSVEILAVRMDDETQACIGDDNFADKDRPVSFTASYVSTKIGDDPVSVKGNKQDSQFVELDDAGSITIYFDESAKGEFIFKYDDAGKVTLSTRCDVSYESENTVLEMRGADSFVAYPHHLQVSATYTYSDPDTGTDVALPLSNGASTGTPHWPAGKNFDLEVAGVCDNDTMTVTPSFSWETDLTVSDYQPDDGTEGDFSPASLEADDYDHGAQSAKASYSEVGTVTLGALAKDYQEPGIDVTGTAAIGRFTPAQFALEWHQSPELAPACSSGGFTYVGQTFGYAAEPVVRVTARNELGDVTKNYTRDGWWKITEAGLVSERSYSADEGSLLLSDGGAGFAYPIDVDGDGLDDHGIGTLTYDEDSAMVFERGDPEDPFFAAINLEINVVDADGISAPTALKVSDIPFTGEDKANGDNTDEMRWGRLVMKNAYGSELAPLAMPLRAEYYNGGSFVTNTADGCTALSVSDLSLNGTASSTATLHDLSSSPLLAGDAGLVFSAPGSPGYIDVQLDLEDMPWLRYDWDGDDGHDDDPAGRASFGLYRGSPAMIYLRETYR